MSMTMQPTYFHHPHATYAQYSLPSPAGHDEPTHSRCSPYWGLEPSSETPFNAPQQVQSTPRYNTAVSPDYGPRQPLHYRPSPATLHSHRTTPMTPARSHRSSSASGAVRRRISRACDQCNQLRTKCDGKSPCAHCVEFGLTCEYNRARKKRGKASRKEIAAQEAANRSAATARSTPTSAATDDNGPAAEFGDAEQAQLAGDLPIQEPWPLSAALDEHSAFALNNNQPQSSFSPKNTYSQQLPMAAPRQDAGRTGLRPSDENSTANHATAVQNYASTEDYQPPALHGEGPGRTPYAPSPNDLYQQLDGAFNMLNPQSQSMQAPTAYGLAATESPYGFMPSPLGGSPGWLSMPTPSAALYQQTMGSNATQHLRYPVLKPLLPYLGSIVPIPVACDLLDLYFQSTSNVFQQPQSPYVLGYVFRKRSFLRGTHPRLCSPALLASMLWVGAQTSESPLFTSPPSARGRICQKLLELTVGLLKPLIHTPAPGSQTQSPTGASATMINGVALGGLGVTLPSEQHDGDGSSPGAAADLDDVVTYIHLATVVSATEYKAASLRWWNAAWSLCRELKLGRELPIPTGDRDGLERGEGSTVNEAYSHLATQDFARRAYEEEHREERRRTWWLCYTMDRHLALCYNRPVFLLDQECEGLLQPIDDSLYQAGEYFAPEPAQLGEAPTLPTSRHRGPSTECRGFSIFGYFTPLMTILGQEVGLKHARSHPLFGMRLRASADWEEHEHEITAQLEAYGQSLQAFAARHGASRPGDGEDGGPDTVPSNEAVTPSGQSVASTGSHLAEALLHTRTVVAYGTHLMHTLHILVHGRWDPIALLDDEDLWISSQSFITATGHAVSAAEALNEILENDPDLSFMPFFFGIYLLQSSFLLLLIADKLRGEASQSVVKACETIVRAHEACVVTLNTEYQRNFRKVMRSALMQVRGRMNEDYGEQQMKRREVLALYRWIGDGSGLAL